MRSFASYISKHLASFADFILILLFLCLFALLFVGTGTVLAIHQVNDMEILWLTHDEAIVSSLLELSLIHI